MRVSERCGWPCRRRNTGCAVLVGAKRWLGQAKAEGVWVSSLLGHSRDVVFGASFPSGP
jgi:hypothetical protein